MLSPDAREVAIELLRPPSGYQLDVTVLTSYSLDLETLLALPLAMLAHADGGLDELIEDPLLVLEALRRAGERVHVFCDESAIAIPRAPRTLFAMLERSVHPVRAKNGGTFHPKLWVARFLAEDATPLLRVAVLSRNLTYDRSWDIALSSEAIPTERKNRRRCSTALGDLLRALGEMAVTELPAKLLAQLELLAAEAERTQFPSPEGFADPVTFHALGLRSPHRAWRPREEGSRLIAIAPFVNRTAIETLAEITRSERTLVGRQDQLDDIAETVLEAWDTKLVLSEAAVEDNDDASQRPSGLHAKLIGIEHAHDVTWFVGSANLTAAAFTGHNVELMAAVTGRKGRREGSTGSGIDRFLDAGFLNLCTEYRRGESAKLDAEVRRAKERIEATRRQIVESDLRVLCQVDGDSWRWTLDGEVEIPLAVEATVWPVSLDEAQARQFAPPCRWTLPIARLTTLVAFRLQVADKRIAEQRFVLKLPAEGFPSGRVANVLRSLIDSPERFLRFLRALLGGLDGLVVPPGESRGPPISGHWGPGLDADTLLEDLLRIAARDPSRLVPVRRLIDDLRATNEGRQVIPEGFLELWAVVVGAIEWTEGR